MITFLLFVLPSIYSLSGKEHNLVMDDAILKSNLKKRRGRAELQRGFYVSKDNKNYVETVGEQGSGILSSMNNANCLIYLPVEKGKSCINDRVKIIKFKNYI